MRLIYLMGGYEGSGVTMPLGRGSVDVIVWLFELFVIKGIKTKIIALLITTPH